MGWFSFLLASSLHFTELNKDGEGASIGFHEIKVLGAVIKLDRAGCARRVRPRKPYISTFTVDQLVALLFDMFVAGMETTSSTLSTGVNLLAKHPFVQRRLQEELDEVVGRDRLPSLADMER